ncbi:Outer membrane protein TolC [Marivirga sericea]|uniref:Outer membrane protein TolC n=1 Tax=Marivirga sericea TaxID=1028 RepID=A0A1X7LAT2_9BACT|nr:TolC family protein [Marivirga sericea]SMG50820.1 Outer membrane protein TolC [Marivirga sericea]
MTKYISIFFLMVWGFSLNAQKISLNEAIAVGMEKNFSIRTAKNIEKEAVTNSNYAFAGFLPIIDITGARNFDVENVEQQFRSGDVNALDGARSNNFNIRGDLTWTLFDGTKMFLDYKSLQVERNQSRFETQAVVENTLGSIIQSYFALVFEQYQYSVLESAVELSEKRLEIAKANYEVGKFSKTELLSAKVDLNTDKSNLLNQDEVMQQARVSLNLLLGEDPNQEFMASDSIQIDETLQLNKLIEDLSVRNKQLLGLMQQENILQLQNKSVMTELLPQLDFNLGYGYTNFESQAGFLLQNQSVGLSYGLSLSWRIFDRLDRSRRNQTTQIAVENNTIAMAELENQLTGDLSSAYVRYRNKLDLIKLEKVNLEVAKENADIAIERYRVGRSNAIELREFQLNAIEAESRLLNAIFLAKQAEVNLLAISGNLLSKEELD